MNRRALEAAFEAIDTFLEIRTPISGVPGISLTIAEKGKILFEKGYGFSRLSPPKPISSRSLFRIASHSKMFAASCFARLVEAGKVDWDDKVSSYVPELKNGKDKRLSRITFHHLLSHTAGIVRDGNNGNFWNLGGPFPDRATLLEEIIESPLWVAPGRQIKYSNYGYGLLGLALERISQMSFDEVLRTEVLDPLGLENTYSDLAVDRRSDVVQAYCGESYGVPLKEVEDIATLALASATGLTSNGRDLAKFLWAHSPSHSRYLKARTKRFLLESVGPVVGSPDNIHYARGFFRFRQGKRDYFGHSGGFTGQITYSLYDLRSQLSVSVLTNCIERRAAPIMRSVFAFIDFYLKRHSVEKRGKETAPFRGAWSNIWYTVQAEPLGDGKVAFYNPLTGWDSFNSASILSVEDAETLKFIEEGSMGWPGQEVVFSGKSRTGFSQLKIGSDDLIPYQKFRQQLGASKRISVPVLSQSKVKKR